MLNEGIETIKTFMGSMFAGIIDNSNKHMLALMVVMLIDSIFGWVRCAKNGQWAFKKAKWGMAGKIVELILISLLYVLDWVLDVNFILNIGVYYFIICEVASILENYAEINGNLPKGLIELLKKLQFNIATNLVEKIKNIIDKIFESNNKNDIESDKNKYEKNTK